MILGKSTVSEPPDPKNIEDLVVCPIRISTLVVERGLDKKGFSSVDVSDKLDAEDVVYSNRLNARDDVLIHVES